MRPLRWGCIGTGFHAGYCHLSVGGLRRERGDRLQLCVHWVVLLKNACSALASAAWLLPQAMKRGWQTADVSSVSSVDHTLVSKHQISNTTTMYLCTCTVCVHTYSCAVYTGQCKIVPRITVML